MNQILGWFSFRSPGNLRRTPYLRFREWFGIVIAVISLIGAYFVYQNIAMPVRARIRAIEDQCQELRKKGEKARRDRNQIELEQKNYIKVIDRLREFENGNFLDARVGQLALIDEINALSRKNGVQLVENVTFLTKKPTEDKSGATVRTTEQPRASKTKSLVFPTFTVKFSIAGDYRKVRLFVHDLETSRQFLVLNLLTVSPESKAKTPGRQGFSSNSTDIGQNPDDITLDLELTAYYRR
jgi:hypothetical protein